LRGDFLFLQLSLDRFVRFFGLSGVSGLAERKDAIRGKTRLFSILRNRMTLSLANEAESASKWTNKIISFRWDCVKPEKP
jgi:hypothetical protein